MSQWTQLAREGLWTNNPALVQLLGLCPLLAVSATVVNALGLALATLLVLVGASTTISLIRHQVPSAVRLPAFVMVIAAFVTCAELLMAAFAYSLYQILGIFIPLIVTNCAILGRADAFASRQPVLPAAIDGLMMGLGFGAVLVLMGAIRELVGQGTLFSDMALLFGPVAAHWQITLVADYQFLFFILPPGAFFVAGLLIALKNVLDQRRAARAQPVNIAPRAERRVRVTGTIK
ncbi:electron transport complex subunit E [Vreelandella aquamarina]|jgi:electron transport complex protein RnfE|uniref:Ion-translocating oxidoreductase complex subunit E n=1 Tax=Vreelandella aquamarina TaxID=77097 RepID=A0A1N6H0B7_9GAMM|nr:MULTISPECIES: electron transport complex subunit E [Halomonas]MCP1303440.1 electron transport complex subunit E [Halomonas sp. R1t8]MCP1330731.1 electron transport complex subunit E [Halomonas sp. R1t4]SIN63570.1 electron transport complex protein RnfE [Halomonas meridiana]SIN76243.1 electron transport complex protein RnfE [Halomonas meridiana]SIO13243.1 electron transport complex protein RnfE [Halomonas meridiana]|tara:strand:+ start:329 stop:1030 length:702 start_codon:yes stop_codon:yes gene_type:complete